MLFKRNYISNNTVNTSTKSTNKRRRAKPLLPKMQKARNICSDFRIFYDRGDIPIRIIHTSSHNKIRWRVPPCELDLKQYLPIFIDGLREKIDPYQFLAIMGTFDLIETSPNDKLQETIPQLIIPFRKALNTKDKDIVGLVCKVLQKLVISHPECGRSLVPYYRQLLPSFNLMKNWNLNIGDKIDYGQKNASNIGDLIQETLELLEKTGGEDAFINIKYMIPTYESVIFNH